jgi:tetratricopeptide (TPR) repeat protein
VAPWREFALTGGKGRALSISGVQSCLLDPQVKSPLFDKAVSSPKRALLLTLAALSCLAQTAPPSAVGLLQQAEKELFAGRYKRAVQLYREATQKAPVPPDAYYGLVRALIEDHRCQEAYAAAEEALRQNPQTAGTQTAAGLAAHRKAEFGKAEQYFHSALKLDPGYAGALMGLASANRVVSQLKTARELDLAAYRRSPGDPQLILSRASTLTGGDHLTALRQALAILDPETDQARNVRLHLADDIALGDREPGRLVSPYIVSRIPLVPLEVGGYVAPEVGIRVRLNGKRSVLLMLDTGAHGISVSPKAAERAGLELLGGMAVGATGLGDDAPKDAYDYLASEVSIGDVVFADHNVSALRTAKSDYYDGLIGADVFQRFLVTIDFAQMAVTLTPRPEGASALDPAKPVDAGPVAAGFYRAGRFGSLLALWTNINGGPPTLFLLDSGAYTSMLDTATAGLSTKLRRDNATRIVGIQGEVKKVLSTETADLVFAGFRQRNSSLTAISLEKISDELGFAVGGILGMPVLRQLKLTIDYREGTVRLEHKK